MLGAIFTEWFSVELGLRQGDPLSSILYIIFIDGLVSEVKKAKEGVWFEAEKINILVFADDVVLLASSKVEMQRLLDVVHLYSRKWRFFFNVDKCRAIVFTSKRVNLDVTPLYLGLERLEEVQRFKYLGLDFKSNLSWVLLKQRIVAKAKSRIALISGLQEAWRLKPA